jgi:hypothetical protein
LELTRTTINLERVSIAGADGQPTAEARYDRELPVETLCRLYELMVVTRDLGGEFVNLQRQGELALFPSCRGQEAARIGATACLHRPIGCFGRTAAIPRRSSGWGHRNRARWWSMTPQVAQFLCATGAFLEYLKWP